MTDNITGKGMDIPILGIRHAVDEIWDSSQPENGGHLKALFADPVFDVSQKFKLSTSQVGYLCHICVIIDFTGLRGTFA